MKIKILPFLFSFTSAAFAQMDCREVVQPDPQKGTVIESKKSEKEERFEETQKVVLSALNKQGNQTYSLLSYLRLMVKKTQDRAIQLLMQNGSSTAEMTKKDPLENVEKSKSLLEEFKNRSGNAVDTKRGIFSGVFRPKETPLPELAKKLQESANTLKTERKEFENRSEQILNSIKSTESGIAELEGEVQYLEKLNKWLLSIKGIENQSTIELHQFSLGILDQITLLNQQIESLKEQSKTLQKVAGAFGPAILEIDKFLNLSYVLVQPVLTYQLNEGGKKKTNDTKTLSYSTLTPDIMSQFFRTFHSGDQVRILDVHSAVNYKGRQIYSIELNRQGKFEILRTESGNQYKTTTLNEVQAGFWGNRIEQVETVVTNLDLNLNTMEVTDSYYKNKWRTYYLSNSSMEYNGIKIDDFVDLTDFDSVQKEIRKVPHQYIFVGQVLGTRLVPETINHRYIGKFDYQYIERVETVNMVGIRAFFYDPSSRSVTKDFLLELTEYEFLKLKLYKKSDEEL